MIKPEALLRVVCALALIGFASPLTAQVAAALPQDRAAGPEIAPHPPTFDFVLEALVETGRFTPTGTYEGRERGFLEILGGSFAGPLMRGTVLPSNRDWPEYYPNGARTTSVEYIYRTDDDVNIFVSVDGWRYANALTGPLAEFEAAHPGGNLLRAFVKLRAPDTSSYAWVNYELFFAVAGTSVSTPDGPRSRIHIYLVK